MGSLIFKYHNCLNKYIYLSENESTSLNFNDIVIEKSFIGYGFDFIMISLECPYCKERVFGIDKVRELHVYLNHGKDKLYKLYKKSYCPSKTNEEITQNWNRFFTRSKSLEKEYLELI